MNTRDRDWQEAVEREDADLLWGWFRRYPDNAWQAGGFLSDSGATAARLVTKLLRDGRLAKRLNRDGTISYRVMDSSAHP